MSEQSNEFADSSAGLPADPLYLAIESHLPALDSIQVVPRLCKLLSTSLPSAGWKPTLSGWYHSWTWQKRLPRKFKKSLKKQFEMGRYHFTQDGGFSIVLHGIEAEAELSNLILSGEWHEERAKEILHEQTD